MREILFFLMFLGLFSPLSAQDTNSSIELFEVDEYQADIYLARSTAPAVECLSDYKHKTNSL